jgi:4,4'-diaponeurosporenoate glycosyltransferase
LPALLCSLENQEVEDIEVIVADDGSQDETAAIARRAGVIVLTIPPKPAGWTGKTWACWTGARAARGDIFVFLDADTRLEPRGLKKLVAAMLKKGGLVSLEPYHRVGRLYEQLSVFFNIIRTASVGAFGLLRTYQVPVGAYGPCIALRRRDYFSMGGHSHPRVRDQILENYNMGKVMREKGLILTCFGGRGAIYSRMYPNGLRELAAGWGKAFSSGAKGTPILILLIGIAWLSGAATAGLGLLTALSLGFPTPALAFLVLYLAYCAQTFWMMRQVGSFSPWIAVLYPIPLTAFFLIFFVSMTRSFFRLEVRWRGRVISTQRGVAGSVPDRQGRSRPPTR